MAVHRRAHHRDNDVGGSQASRVQRRLQRVPQDLLQDWFGAFFAERHAAGVDGLHLRGVNIQQSDRPTVAGQNDAEREPDVSTTAHDDDVLIVLISQGNVPFCGHARFYLQLARLSFERLLAIVSDTAGARNARFRLTSICDTGHSLGVLCFGINTQ